MLKVAQRNAVASLKFFGPWDTSDFIAIVLFTFVLQRHLMQLVL